MWRGEERHILGEGIIDCVMEMKVREQRQDGETETESVDLNVL